MREAWSALSFVGSVALLYVLARATVPRAAVSVTSTEDRPGARELSPIEDTTLHVFAPAHAVASESTPSDWKALPEKTKQSFLRRNYGADATSDAAPSVLRVPPLPPAVAEDDHHRRVPFERAAHEVPPSNWKDRPEKEKREFLRRNYGDAALVSNNPR